MKGKKNKKNCKEFKNRKADDKKIAEFNGSHEQFLLEIEEYAEKLNKHSDSDEKETKQTPLRKSKKWK